MKKNRNEKIENRLSSAVRQMIPEDMCECIMQNIAQEERTIIMNDTNITPTPTKKKLLARWISIATAACILLVCGVFGGNYYFKNMVVDSIVDIDVNPGIEISTNKNDVVLNVSAVNSDAEKVLEGMNLKNTELKVAVNAIIGSMVQNGYLIDGENSILVTVQNSDDQRAAQLRNLILSDIDASLKDNNVTASVVNQTVSGNTSAEDFAKEQGISFGKAAFILNLCAKNSSLDSTALSKMSLKEITALVVKKNVDIRDIVDYDADDSMGENIEDAVEDMDKDDHASQSGRSITAAKAKKIALTHAGIAASDAVFIHAELDTDDDVKIYDIEFTVDGMEYDYEINAKTGAIIFSDKEAEDKSSESSQTKTSVSTSSADAKKKIISLNKAKEVALKHAGASEKSVIYEKAALDADDGVQVYEIEFRVDSMEYDYEIDAKTGSVIHCESEADD